MSLMEQLEREKSFVRIEVENKGKHGQHSEFISTRSLRSLRDLGSGESIVKGTWEFKLKKQE